MAVAALHDDAARAGRVLGRGLRQRAGHAGVDVRAAQVGASRRAGQQRARPSTGENSGSLGARVAPRPARSRRRRGRRCSGSGGRPCRRGEQRAQRVLVQRHVDVGDGDPAVAVGDRCSSGCVDRGVCRRRSKVSARSPSRSVSSAERVVRRDVAEVHVGAEAADQPGLLVLAGRLEDRRRRRRPRRPRRRRRRRGPRRRRRRGRPCRSPGPR